MSLSLEFYSIAWDELGCALGSRNRKIFRSVLDRMEPEFEEVFDAEDFEGGSDFERGVERWIEGELPPPGEPAPFPVRQLADCLGFVGLVKTLGHRIGILQHSAYAGDLFRNEFLGGVAERMLLAPFPLSHLLSRPILGCESEDFPFWGGLSATELAAVAPRIRDDFPPGVEPPVLDEWLVQLWRALAAAADADRDLITIYG